MNTDHVLHPPRVPFRGGPDSLERNLVMAIHSAVKAALKAKLDELEGRASAVEAHLGTPGSSDWEENASESADDDVVLKIGDVTTQDIGEIRLALRLIDSGRYGKCVSCGAAISEERLAELPYATRCIGCA
jgi:DnaK suppressor protein